MKFLFLICYDCNIYTLTILPCFRCFTNQCELNIYLVSNVLVPVRQTYTQSSRVVGAALATRRVFITARCNKQVFIREMERERERGIRKWVNTFI